MCIEKKDREYEYAKNKWEGLENTGSRTEGNTREQGWENGTWDRTGKVRGRDAGTRSLIPMSGLLSMCIR